MKPWELTIKFDEDPTCIIKRCPTFVNFKNEPYTGNYSASTAEEMFENAENIRVPSVEKLKFLKPSCFVAGHIHSKIIEWEKIIKDVNSSDIILD